MLSISLVKEAKVTMALYDLIGNLVETIEEANMPAGNHQVELNAEALEPGIYMLKTVIKNNDQEVTKMIKMVVSK